MENVCQNPECGKAYPVEDERSDDGFCSFNCWEKVNCQTPKEIHFEEFAVNELT
jgi:hypothetical protein